jgi:hypothetical protein
MRILSNVMLAGVSAAVIRHHRGVDRVTLLQKASTMRRRQDKGFQGSDGFR